MYHWFPYWPYTIGVILSLEQMLHVVMGIFHCLPSVNSLLFSTLLCTPGNWQVLTVLPQLPHSFLSAFRQRGTGQRSTVYEERKGRELSPSGPSLLGWGLLAAFSTKGCSCWQACSWNHSLCSIHCCLSFPLLFPLNSVRLSSVTHLFPSETLTDTVFGSHLLDIKQ